MGYSGKRAWSRGSRGHAPEDSFVEASVPPEALGCLVFELPKI